MMCSTVPMRIAKIGYITVSLLLCAFGILLLVTPDVTPAAFGTAAGCAMIVFGTVKLIGYFSRDLFRLAFQYDLASGLLLILLGCVLLISPDRMMTVLCTVWGILILSDGLLKLQIALDAQRFGLKRWWLILTAAIVSALFGAVLIFRPSESLRVLTVLFGLSCLTDGLLNLGTVLCAVRIIRHQKPDCYETEFEERKN